MNLDKFKDKIARVIYKHHCIPTVALIDEILSIPIGGEVVEECDHKNWLYQEDGQAIYGRYAKDCPNCSGLEFKRPRLLKDCVDEK